MSIQEPRLELRRDDVGEIFAVLWYETEPVPLFAAIALRSAAATVAVAGLPLYLSLIVGDGVGRRSWRITCSDDAPLSMTREIPQVLKDAEEPLEVLQ